MRAYSDKRFFCHTLDKDYEPVPDFSVGVKDKASWSKRRSESLTYVCALCWRRIRQGSEFMRAVYPAYKGAYIQMFHPTCALIAQTNRAAQALRTGGEAAEWARESACLNCENWSKCALNPFDCERATRYLRLMGGNETSIGGDKEDE